MATPSARLEKGDAKAVPSSYEAMKEELEKLRRLHERPEWTPDFAKAQCTGCSLPFSTFRRRHHCRHCGCLVCHECSSKRMALVRLGYERPVRVCDICFTKPSLILDQKRALARMTAERDEALHTARLNKTVLDQLLTDVEVLKAESEESLSKLEMRTQEEKGVLMDRISQLESELAKQSQHVSTLESHLTVSRKTEDSLRAHISRLEECSASPQSHQAASISQSGSEVANSYPNMNGMTPSPQRGSFTGGGIAYATRSVPSSPYSQHNTIGHSSSKHSLNVGGLGPSSVPKSPSSSPMPEWVPDKERKECSQCGKKFGTVRRRHHCRVCGEVVCGGCSNKRVAVPEAGYVEKVRTCLKCYNTRMLEGDDDGRAPSSAVKIPNGLDDSMESSVGSDVDAATASDHSILRLVGDADGNGNGSEDNTVAVQ